MTKTPITFNTVTITDPKWAKVSDWVISEGSLAGKSGKGVPSSRTHLSSEFFLLLQLSLSLEFFIMELLTTSFLEIDTLTDLVLDVHL